MTVWACARQGEPTTYHDTESRALAHARDRECVVHPVDVDEAQDAARSEIWGQRGTNGGETDIGTTDGTREPRSASDVVAREGAA